MPIDLNKLAKAACWAKVENVDRAQVNKLLEVLESTKNVLYVTIFIAKQRARGEIGRYTARTLSEILLSLGENVEEAREALGLFKWLFEAAADRRRPPMRCDTVTLKDYLSWVLS